MRKLEMPPTEYGQLVISMVHAAALTMADKTELLESWFAPYPIDSGGRS